jgi:phage shock protein PspC (stress-responsive transcriptional regulator)
LKHERTHRGRRPASVTGIARCLDADVTLVRITIAALSLLTAAGAALYIAAWLLIPPTATTCHSPPRGSPATAITLAEPDPHL